MIIVPFENAYKLRSHFMKHGHEFGVQTAAEYEQLADRFIFGPMNDHTQECVRRNGQSVRLDLQARHFGVGIVSSRVVKTFYVVPIGKIRNRGGPEQFLTSECQRTDL